MSALIYRQSLGQEPTFASVEDGTLGRRLAPRPGPLGSGATLRPHRLRTGNEGHALLSTFAMYYQASEGTTAAAFALQLYFLAQHWFDVAHGESDFITAAFQKAAQDVLSNPRYRGRKLRGLFPSTTGLAVLGKQHLQDHLRPAYMSFLRLGIETERARHSGFVAAFRAAAKSLRDQHERFLTGSVPYGISRLQGAHLLSETFGYQVHASLIQSNAQGMRYYATVDVLRSYAATGTAEAKDAYNLAHAAD